MIQQVVWEVHSQPHSVKYVMNNFIIAVEISYLPLHEEAWKVALQVGTVEVNHGKTSCKIPLATNYISKAEKTISWNLKEEI